MNSRRNRSKNNKNVIKKDKIIRCRLKMIPVFENDTCDKIVKKDNNESNNFCKNCKNSF